MWRQKEVAESMIKFVLNGMQLWRTNTNTIAIKWNDQCFNHIFYFLQKQFLLKKGKQPIWWESKEWQSSALEHVPISRLIHGPCKKAMLAVTLGQSVSLTVTDRFDIVSVLLNEEKRSYLYEILTPNIIWVIIFS